MTEATSTSDFNSTPTDSAPKMAFGRTFTVAMMGILVVLMALAVEASPYFLLGGGALLVVAVVTFRQERLSVAVQHRALDRLRKHEVIRDGKAFAASDAEYMAFRTERTDNGWRLKAVIRRRDGSWYGYTARLDADQVISEDVEPYSEEQAAAEMQSGGYKTATPGDSGRGR